MSNKRETYPLILTKKAMAFLILGTLMFSGAGIVFAGTKISAAVPCKQIKDKEPVEPGSIFPSSIGRIYFHTVVNTTEEPTIVTHEWYYKNNKISEVKLEVNFPRTRTWSYKTIQP